MIYVDWLWESDSGRKYSHMYSGKSIDELHDFAYKIGLSSEWFVDWNQNDEPYYELTPEKRRMALIAGAKAYTKAEALSKLPFLIETQLRMERY